MTQASMARSLREIANALESGLVTPRILQEVETFITKFPMAEVLTCPEDKLSKCPPEILEEIFQYLDYKDLKSVVLVNKTLCDVGKKPKFWYKSMVRLQSLDDGVGFLRSEREVKGLEAIGLRSEKSLELMTAMSSGSSLREVSLQDCLLDLVEPRMLSVAFSNLVKVDLSNSNLGEHQVAALFSLMDSGCKIRSLNLEEVDLSNVAPELLSSTTRLVEVNLSATLMTDEQMRVMWDAIMEKDCKFTSFEMTGVNLGNVAVEALVKVASKVGKIGIGNTSITPLQATAIIAAFDGNVALQEVDMSDLPLSGVESRFFAEVFSRTKKLNLANAGLTADQLSQLLQGQTHEGVLEDLDLSANQVHLLNPELMATSLNNMKSVTLVDSGITKNQVEENCEIIQSLYSLHYRWQRFSGQVWRDPHSPLSGLKFLH